MVKRNITLTFATSLSPKIIQFVESLGIRSSIFMVTVEVETKMTNEEILKRHGNSNIYGDIELLDGQLFIERK